MVVLQCGVGVPVKLVIKVLFFFSFKTVGWEQRQWNRWDLATRVEGMDVAWAGMCFPGAAAFASAVCHTLRNLEKRSGVPEDPAKSAVPDCERASEGARRTPMRKKIHPRCRSSPNRHQSRMRVIVG